MNPIRLLCAGATLLAACSTTAAAADDLFLKGTRDFELGGSYIQPIRFSQDRFYNLTLAGGYYFWDHHSVNLELQGYYVDQPFVEDAVIGGVGVLMRWHFLRLQPVTFFFDGGGARSYSETEIPEFGTHFNFTAKTGFGMTCQLRDNCHLIGGARYFHLSNGQIHGRDQNPSYDGVQFWGGVMWTF